MAPASRAYLDQQYAPGDRLGLSWAGHVEAREAYAWDPATLRRRRPRARRARRRGAAVDRDAARPAVARAHGAPAAARDRRARVVGAARAVVGALPPAAGRRSRRAGARSGWPSTARPGCPGAEAGPARGYGHAVRLRDLVDTSAAVAATPARGEKVRALAALLAQASPEDVRPAVAYLSGALTQRQIGVGWASLRDLPAPAAAAVADGRGGRPRPRRDRRDDGPGVAGRAARGPGRPARARRRRRAALPDPAARRRPRPGRAGRRHGRRRREGRRGARGRRAPRAHAPRRPRARSPSWR